MWKWLDETLGPVGEFRNCFSRGTTHAWFVIIIIGMMIRIGHLGTSDIVRDLCLVSTAYSAINRFFRADSWNNVRLGWAWLSILKKLPFLFRVDGRLVLVGDGVKQSKEGRRMPGVKKLHQESDNSAKGEYIFGHMFGGLGLLIGSAYSKLYCVLISMKLHEGLSAINGWDQGESYKEESHVVKMIRDAAVVVQTLGPSLLLLDRLFLTVPMLTALAAVPLLHVVTRAKLNASAFYYPKPKTGRGAKPKKGEPVKVAELFKTKADAFITATVNMYGKMQEVSYYCVDLQWGKKLYQKLRFVLVNIDGVQNILVSTDLTLAPVVIIELYGRRFKIECAFREFKQVIAGFCYRFWSKYMPRLKRYKSNDENQEQLKSITDKIARDRIQSTIRAIEGYVLLGCIALGLLQIISIKFASMFSSNKVRFMRTKSNTIPSEATVADYIRKNIYQLFRFFPDLAITAIIKKQQSTPDDPMEQSSA